MCGVGVMKENGAPPSWKADEIDPLNSTSSPGGEVSCARQSGLAHAGRLSAWPSATVLSSLCHYRAC